MSQRIRNSEILEQVSLYEIPISSLSTTKQCLFLSSGICELGMIISPRPKWKSNTRIYPFS